MACKVMGIVNVTPDSFSDGGKYFSAGEAVRRARNMAAEGAALIDIGGESTRPGAERLGWQEEWERIRPVVEELSAERPAGAEGRPVMLSVDTYHPETAERSLASGVDMINCVYAEPARRMLELARSAGRCVSLVVPYSCHDIRSAAGDGVKVYLDPMIGFGPSREEDIGLLRSVRDMAAEGPVLVGASRKRVIKRLTGVKTPGKDIAGNLAVVVWAAVSGASIVRVHDVRESVQALRVIDILRGEGEGRGEP